MSKKRTYTNKNGNFSVKEWIRMLYNGEEMDDYMRHSTLSKDPCPPLDLIDANIPCFYCFSCMEYCNSLVKEYKNHYKCQNIKYSKEELYENKKC